MFLIARWWAWMWNVALMGAVFVASLAQPHLPDELAKGVDPGKVPAFTITGSATASDAMSIYTFNPMGEQEFVIHCGFLDEDQLHLEFSVDVSTDQESKV